MQIYHHRSMMQDIQTVIGDSQPDGVALVLPVRLILQRKKARDKHWDARECTENGTAQFTRFVTGVTRQENPARVR